MPVKDAAATSVDVAAFRLDRTKDRDDQGDQPISLTYVLERDAKTIFDTPAEDLVFIDPKATRAEVAAIFGLRHPPSHPALTNLVSDSPRYSVTLPLRYHVKLQQEWYAGVNVREVCEAAEALGKPVRVTGGLAWRIKRRPLYEHGCYLRTLRDGAFVVYNPKIAARGLKRIAKRGSVDRSTPYVICAEFMAWAKAMQSMNTAGGLTNIVGNDNLWTYRRSEVMNRLRRDLALFELLYGRGAYWQLEEFRTLIETWKKKGPATWGAFERAASYGCGSAYRNVFRLLDEEADRKRKPRKRKLKLRLPKGYRWRNET